VRADHRIARLGRLGLVAITGLALVVAASPAVAGTGIGAIFNLGRTNTVNSTTTLTGKSTSRLLQLTNTSTGAALQLTTKSTVAPMKVNSSVVVTNLNADKLDGADAADLMKANAHPDAATLDGIDSTGFVQPSGQILITAGLTSWTQIAYPGTLSILNYSNTSRWEDTVEEAVLVGNFPDTPVALYGRATELVGVEICYHASAGAPLTYVALNTTLQTTGWSEPQTAVLSDDTHRTDAACRVYAPASPIALTSEMGVNALVEVACGADTHSFEMGRTTWIFNATALDAVAPTGP
jgi:hypothetical protein